MSYSERIIKQSFIWYWVIFVAYIALRCVAWRKTYLLEDSDSIGLLYQIKLFLTFDFKKISNMGPDVTPFYLFWSALWSLPGWSVETGARVCSLFFSSLLFVALVFVGKRVATSLEVVIGLLIVVFSPVLISLSYAVLTEPSYVALCYIGLWLFITRYENPRIWEAWLLGIIFALSFLNRTEGILYLFVIPVIQGLHYLSGSQKKYGLKRLGVWCCIYVLSFSIPAIPQIWQVSTKIGHLSINGRQVWTYILKYPDGKSYDEKIYGLYYSPQQINIAYIQSHSGTNKKFLSTISIKSFLKDIRKNLRELYKEKLGIMIGPVGFFFFAIGLIAIYKSNRRFECFTIIAFISSSLVAPLIHNVIIRHIAVIAPLMMLVEGIGIVYLARLLTAKMTLNPYGNIAKNVLTFIFLFAVCGYFIAPFKHIYFYQPRYNPEYNPAIILKSAAVIKDVIQKDALKFSKIVDRKMYLPFYGDINGAPLPYTNYEGLVQYCKLNNVDFLFLRYNLIKEFPFLSTFYNRSKINEFELLYSEMDDYGLNELYRVRLFRKPSTF